jgi:hypothetical protein
MISFILFKNSFNNKKKKIQSIPAEEKITPFDLISVIFGGSYQPMSNIGGANFKNCGFHRRKKVFYSERFHLDLLAIHLFITKQTFLRIVKDIIIVHRCV